ncbi:MAG: hypothetical protein J0L65_11280 [Xanthomonadales bacterium]|nr:hypothetical protein [Xanthomonadales bacterium]
MTKFPLKTLPAAVMAFAAAFSSTADASEWNQGTQVTGGFDFYIAKNVSGERLVAQWLTYDAYGRPLRLIGVGPVEGNGATLSLFVVSDRFELAPDEYLLPPPSTDEYLLPPPTAKEYLLPPPSTDEYLLPPPSTDEYLLPPPTAKEYLLPPYWGEVSIEFVSCNQASVIALTADGKGELNTVLISASTKRCDNPLDAVRAIERGGRF